MTVKLRQARPGASESEIDALERELRGRLPSDFRGFLLENDGGFPEDNEFAIPGQDNESGVQEFMSVSQIRDDIARYGARYADGFVPIAFAEGGNLVFIALDDGRALFWDHEYEHADPFHKLAPSFRAFWESLEKFDPSSVQLKPGQVQSAWIDPDLLG